MWADSATLELLLPLAEASEEWPLAIVGAYRERRRSRAATRCGGSGRGCVDRAGWWRSRWSRSIRRRPR